MPDFHSDARCDSAGKIHKMDRRGFIRAGCAALAGTLAGGSSSIAGTADIRLEAIFPGAAPQDGANFSDPAKCILNFCQAPVSSLLLNLSDGYPILRALGNDGLADLRSAGNRIKADPASFLRHPRERILGKNTLAAMELVKSNGYRVEGIRGVLAAQMQGPNGPADKALVFDEIEDGITCNSKRRRGITLQSLIGSMPRLQIEHEHFARGGGYYFTTRRGEDLLRYLARLVADEPESIDLLIYCTQLALNLKGYADDSYPGRERLVSLCEDVIKSAASVRNDFVRSYVSAYESEANAVWRGCMPQHTELVYCREVGVSKGISVPMLDWSLVGAIEYIRQLPATSASEDERKGALTQIACGFEDFDIANRVESIRKQLRGEKDLDPWLRRIPKETIEFWVSDDFGAALSSADRMQRSPKIDRRLLRKDLPRSVRPFVDDVETRLDRIAVELDKISARDFWFAVVPGFTGGYAGMSLAKKFEDFGSGGAKGWQNWIERYRDAFEDLRQMFGLK